MASKVAVGLGAVAVGMGVAMATGSGIAAAAPDDSAASDSTASENAASDDTASENAASENAAVTNSREQLKPRARGASTGQTAAKRSPALARKTPPSSSSVEIGDVPSVTSPAGASVSREPRLLSQLTLDSEQFAVGGAAVTAIPKIAAYGGADDVVSPSLQFVSTARVLSAAHGAAPAAATSVEALTGLAGVLSSLALAVAAVGSDVRYFLFGAQTTATPSQLDVSLIDGVTQGTLDAHSDPRDRLTFTISSQPQYGSVQVGPNGTYTYTPNDPAGIPEGGLADSFAVTIRNDGFNLRSLLGLIDPSLNTTTLIVPVSVPEIGLDSGALDKTFYVRNFSSKSLVLNKIYSGAGAEYYVLGPQVGEPLLPGDTDEFHMVAELGSHSLYAEYVDPANPGVVYNSVNLYWDPNGQLSVRCGGSNTACTPDPLPDMTKDYPGNSIVFLDKPGTVVEITDSLAQSALLDELALNNKLGTPTFKIISQDTKAWGSPIEVQSIGNGTVVEEVLKNTYISEVKITDSLEVGVAVKLKLGPIFKTEISSKYNHAVENSTTYSQELSIPIPPNSTVTTYMRPPVTRYTGDLTVHLGNTTFVLKKISVDEPDQANSGRRPSYYNVQKPFAPVI